MERAKRRRRSDAGPSRRSTDRTNLVDQLREANEHLITANLRSQELAQQADAARHRAEFLTDASELLAVSLDYEAAPGTVARLAVPRFADWALLDLIDEDGSIHRVEVAHPNPGQDAVADRLRRIEPRDAFEGPAAQALRTERPIFIPDLVDEELVRAAQSAEHLAVLRSIGPRSVLAAPLVARNRKLGVLTFMYTGESGRQYGPDDVIVAAELARRCALAIDNARLYRRAEESNRLKDEFLAMLSHELRTPLNAILGWSRMLRSGVLPTTSRERALMTIERNAKAQAQLIEDLLDVSRIATGKLRLNVQAIDLPAVLSAAIDVVHPAADAKGVAIELFLDGDAPRPFTGDPDRLQQVFWNLLSNAVKFTPRGGRITVGLRRTGSDVEVKISDTGEGIPRPFLKYVFDPFRQAHGGLVRRHAGLGLGLAIVQRLVELHGGTATAESAGEGQGATFIITLPVGTLHESALSEGEHPPDIQQADPSRTTLSGVRVLVVEDDPDARELLAIAFHDSGAAVTSVGSAHEALDAISSRQSDALVADIGLPDHDGYALIRQIRSLERADGVRLPAIAVTAYASRKDRRDAIDAGYDDHVGKPIEPDHVAAVLAAVLQRVSAKRAK